MDYANEAELRNFSFFLSLSFSLSLLFAVVAAYSSPPRRLFNDCSVRCLKVSTPVALKAPDKKESFGIMVILLVVKRNMNERMQKDKEFRRIFVRKNHIA